jgi:membrane-bound metal-dependent hydrolase YbcI (DUF457 family)
MPIAASLSPGLAIGGVWWGMVGGGFPDWLDLRSEFRSSLRLRHRGVSHSVFVAALASIGFGMGLVLLGQQTYEFFGLEMTVPDEVIRPWFLCFLGGVLSHLVSDALTHSGIQPLLPISRVKLRLLPKFLRSRYDGYLDTLLRFAAMVVVAAGIAYFVVGR